MLPGRLRVNESPSPPTIRDHILESSRAHPLYCSWSTVRKKAQAYSPTEMSARVSQGSTRLNKRQTGQDVISTTHGGGNFLPGSAILQAPSGGAISLVAS